jgi:hypothetical protein
MSQENVELVRRILSEFGETLQPVSPGHLTSPEMVWNTGSWTAWTGPSEQRGIDGFMRFFGEWIAAYDDWAQEISVRWSCAGGDLVEPCHRPIHTHRTGRSLRARRASG